jgi:hypothetical protein
MYVMTIDQRGSTADVDRVPGLIAELTSLTTATFERSVGDELQGVVERAPEVVDVALHALRSGHWYIGVGIGTATLPASASPREGFGTAFVAARKAVELAKTAARVPLSVVSGNVGHGAERAELAKEGATTCANAEAVLRLLGRLVQDRTGAQWKVTDRLRLAHGNGNRHGSQKQVARELGITEQSVSRAVFRSGWQEEWAARPAAVALLEQADSHIAAAAYGAGTQGVPGQPTLEKRHH